MQHQGVLTVPWDGSSRRIISAFTTRWAIGQTLGMRCTNNARNGKGWFVRGVMCVRAETSRKQRKHSRCHRRRGTISNPYSSRSRNGSSRFLYFGHGFRSRSPYLANTAGEKSGHKEESCPTRLMFVLRTFLKVLSTFASFLLLAKLHSLGLSYVLDFSEPGRCFIAFLDVFDYMMLLLLSTSFSVLCMYGIYWKLRRQGFPSFGAIGFKEVYRGIGHLLMSVIFGILAKSFSSVFEADLDWTWSSKLLCVLYVVPFFVMAAAPYHNCQYSHYCYSS